VRDKIASLISKKSTAQDIQARESSAEELTDKVDELTDILITPPKNASS